MSALDAAAAVCVALGAGFFWTGTLGLLRFPDAYSRLHALTKADTLGLGLIVLGLCLRAPTLALVFKLIFIWLLSLLAGATNSYLIAQSARRREAALREGAPYVGTPHGGAPYSGTSYGGTSYSGTPYGEAPHG
ncbi:multisubunit sodium/proton antiporter, MrpG subunit (2.A.63.1) [Truepera radiovictrix DSM 17093]|uniref:Multisubunit sodium/proton antiporter, MrpG subunit (2.A.63.1) n=1 Tax=Truepera radiovictrix (strain DSM 17093 / CIP 108686 / LMG 22925 / RQ-24) TaxID=649638 RepID=D7CQ83_TRURR|nr:monovalent cation/H(+) antiporter subunit G [Truepera radiovictrix]ADI14867.1 multisubunit sodium/proton antiporter, MrpG subunit (2.A.63.1) [Truepera radiovictrix DSM 17093]WMT56582.1 monovalent cation/H(+) antiporter subunit G [Truepera radiovictrix]